MTDSTLGPCSPKNEPPAGWGVLLVLLGDWGTTLRLICVLIAAVVELVVIHLGTVGVGVLITLGSGGYGTKRLHARHRRRRAVTVADAR